MVARYGAERLLYGSNYPRTSMGGPRLMVAHGDIDEAARRLIAGDNLRRLLQEEDFIMSEPTQPESLSSRANLPSPASSWRPAAAPPAR